MYVMTPEYGASTQLEKIDMLDYAGLIPLNKSDKRSFRCHSSGEKTVSA